MLAASLLSALRRTFGLEPGEERPALLAAAFFFCVLSSYYILRPLRDAMGIAGGVRQLQWMFTGTLVVMLALQFPFGLLVSRVPRRRFVPWTYRAIAASLAVFYAGFLLLDGPAGTWLARAFFVWVSVFNLLAVSVFWGLMADLFGAAQARRLFGLFGLGGTIGALAGAALTGALASRIEPIHLLPCSALLLEAAVFCLRRLTSVASREPAGEPEAIGGGWGDSFLQVLGSPYLVGVCLYLLAYTATSTVLYFEQAHLVEAAVEGDGARTALFARIDFSVQALTLVIQALLTGRILAFLGLAAGLTLLPLLTASGFLALAAYPGLAVVVVFQVARRTMQFAVGKPAREVLFTGLPRSLKYKAKSLIDTFVYRGGDALTGWAFALATAAGASLSLLALAAAPLALAWAGLGFVLGRSHGRRGRARAPGPAQDPVSRPPD